MQQLLQRLGIVWKRGRSHVHSPDPAYAAKLADVAALRQRAAAEPSRYVLAYLDEVTVLRQPTVAMSYAAEGQEQPLAERSHCADTQTRVVATLDALTGRVVYRRAHRITLATLVQFYRDLRTAYPEAERIYVVQDNWPVHFHPDVLAALEPQQCRWPWPRPANWRTKARRDALKNYGQLALPIQLVPLPTYASWANPIEKLWRKLRQDVTHHHPWADDLARLRSEIDTFLDQFAEGSPALLRYTGLCPG